MPKFGAESLKQLATLDPRLQRIYNEAIKEIDFRITKGFRDKAEQEAAFLQGTTTLHWPHGNHNKKPSQAGDRLPFPIPKGWASNEGYIRRIFFIAGYIKAVADRLGIPIRQGVDWDGDGNFWEGDSWDSPHDELVKR